MSVTVRRKARKAHRCDGCTRVGAIQPGDVYLTHTALAGDEFGYHEYGSGNRPRRSNECAGCATRYGRAELLAGPAGPMPAEPRTATVLDIAAAFVLAAERDGVEMFVAKLHFLCVQVQGWTLACSGRLAFTETIYADADGYRIDEISTAYAPLGDGVFTLQAAIDAGVITLPCDHPQHSPASNSAGGQEITQQ